MESQPDRPTRPAAGGRDQQEGGASVVETTRASASNGVSEVRHPQVTWVEQPPGESSGPQERQTQHGRLRHQQQHARQERSISQPIPEVSFQNTDLNLQVARPNREDRMYQQELHRFYAQAALTAARTYFNFYQHSASSVFPNISAETGSIAFRFPPSELIGPVRGCRHPNPSVQARASSEKARTKSPENQNLQETKPSGHLEDPNHESSSKDCRNQRGPQEEPAAGMQRAGLKNKCRYKKRIEAEVLIPCRARGVPNDHNVETAVIRIPANTKHGDYLFCTHPICRIQGSKFRYCARCKLPASRGNFRKRHNHDESAPVVHDSGNGNDDGDRSVESLGNVKCPLQRNSAGRGERKMARAKPSVKSITPMDSSPVGAGAGTYTLPHRTAGQHGDSREEPRRRALWDVLLDTRPGSHEEAAMKAWLDEVVDVSERGEPLLFAPKAENNQASENGDAER